jgi:chromatin assembly factor 1 subunit B
LIWLDGSLILWKQCTDKETSTPVFGDPSNDDEDGVEKWRIHQMIRGGSSEMFDMTWSPDGSMIMVGCLDNTAKVWDLKESEYLSRFFVGFWTRLCCRLRED